MAIGYSPKIVTEGLALYYDVGNVKSYKGEPTTNLTTDTPSQGGWTGTYSVLDSSTKKFRFIVSNFAANPGAGWRSFTWDLRAYTGQSVTISATVNVPAASPGTFAWIMMGQGNTYTNNSGAGGYLGYSAASERVYKSSTVQEHITWSGIIGNSGTANQPSGHVGFTIWYNDGTPGINSYVEVSNVQIEIKSHATPFVNGTRSSTQGLLDLTGTTSIDLSNVSFDSDGNIDFDGSNDFIETSVITTNSSNITSISWIYLEGWDSPNSTLGLSVDSSLANGGFRVYNTSSNIGVWQRRSDSSGVTAVSGNYRVPKKQWVQVAFVSDNGSGKIYINDHVAASGTFTSPGLVNGPAWVSRYSGGGYHLNGKVDNVMLFNRALSEAEIVSNFNRNKKKHLGADSLLDHTSDGGAWIRWWWYTGVGWPGHETEALGHPFGTFDSSSHYGFQRLPEGLNKDSVELLAKDGDGNIYKWDFADTSGTAQSVWDSFTQGTQGVWANNGAFMPTVIAGAFHGAQQDSWQYRASEGVVSFMLDDDTCDCYSTLNAGHAMCGDSGWSQTYAQPDGAYLRYGVDTLNDGGCLGPVPTRQLELYYRIKQ